MNQARAADFSLVNTPFNGICR